jgi:hypothetical protein
MYMRTYTYTYFAAAPWHCSVFLCMLSDPEILGDSLIQFCYGVVWVRRLSYPIPLRRCMGNVEFSGVSELYLARLVLGSVLIIFGVLSGGFRILTCVYFYGSPVGLARVKIYCDFIGTRLN